MTAFITSATGFTGSLHRTIIFLLSVFLRITPLGNKTNSAANQPFYPAMTFGAFIHRILSDSLPAFKTQATIFAFIFVGWQIYAPKDVKGFDND
jgi:hypothetical protein